MDLPIYDKNAKKGEDGLTIVKRIVERELKWRFRKNHQEDDFGIDAYFDVITEDGGVTGKSVAVQVKTGPSYFKEKNAIGWIYRGEIAHLNYYLNHDIPVIIVIVDEENEIAYWCLCDPKKMNKAGANWKITIPSVQKLNLASKQELKKYVSPLTDYVTQLDKFWKTNDEFIKNDRILLTIDKRDIENMQFIKMVEVFKRFEVNEELISHLKGSVDIMISGYDDDERELYEIKEVMDWTRMIFEKIDSWAYFLNKDDSRQFLTILFFAYGDFERIDNNETVFKTSMSSDFLLKLMEDLNNFGKRNGINQDIIVMELETLMKCFGNTSDIN